MRLLLVAIVASSTLACASSAGFRLSAGESSYPVSLSRSIVDEQGEVYRPRKDEVVGRFRRSMRHWRWLYGAVSLSRPANLSALLDREVAKYGGDAVINLRARATYGWYKQLTTVLGILPDSVRVTVEGDVVRRSGDGEQPDG